MVCAKKALKKSIFSIPCRGIYLSPGLFEEKENSFILQIVLGKNS